jgi:hypothetical protein
MDEFALCAIPVAIVVATFGTIVLIRWFKHREILAMVEKGTLPPQYVGAPRRWRGRILMGWGIALAMLGLALVIGLWPLGFVWMGGENPYPLHFGPWMLIGLIPLFIGLALLIMWFLTRKEDASAPEVASEEESPVLGD